MIARVDNEMAVEPDRITEARTPYPHARYSPAYNGYVHQFQVLLSFHKSLENPSRIMLFRKKYAMAAIVSMVHDCHLKDFGYS
jgi:hypothetical protein